MDVKLINVSLNEYSLLDETFKIVKEDHADRFAILRIDTLSYGLAWYGDLITPVVEYLEHYDLFLIGINQSALAISRKDGRIVFCIGLNDNFMFFIKYKTGYGIITETTVTLINGSNASLRKLIIVPDIIVSCSITETEVDIKTLDNHYLF